MNDESLDRITELALRKIESRRVPIAAPAAAAPRSYSRLYRVAAVVSSFRPDSLRKLDPKADDFDALLSDSAPLESSEASERWTLLPSTRAAVIARMDRGELTVATAAANLVAENDDPLVEALRELNDPQSSIGRLGIPALVAISPVLSALRSGYPWAPISEDVERRLEFLRLLQPFERLVGTHFAGRKAELQQLSDYVGVLPPGSTYEAITRMVSFPRKAPLLLYGAGGVGKSTLVAKFILMHATLPDARRFPFAYLDFDRPALLASEPATILVEAVRQIGLQYPVAYSAAQRLREEWNEKLQESGRRRGPIRKTAGSADRTTRKRVLDEFVRFLGTLDVVRGPLLLVLDTFEEVQHRSDVYVGELMKFLDELGHAVPRLRTILSGRAEVPGIHVDSKLPLPDFDNAAAVGFLQQRGVTDSVVANAIVKQVGGNPLTLHLAAAVAAGEGATKDGISDLDTHKAFGLIRVKKRNIQGQLFQRILDHIHDQDVVKIAHPGLVLRRVTADLIQKVLAKPCGIDVPTKERAAELFEKLRKEVALVSPAGEGV
ncbi:MAG TPA: ATP-binding protein, partial [Thermoanaerobaculia bacterium]